MYSIYNEGKSVVFERFIRTLTTKIYKCITSVSKNVYIDELDDILGEYNNTYYRTIRIKPVDVNWFEEGFIVSEIKNTIPWTYVINDLNGEGIIRTFHEKELQKANQKEFRIEKVIKRKGDTLYVKWKDYDHSFNSWIDKKDFV